MSAIELEEKGEAIHYETQGSGQDGDHPKDASFEVQAQRDDDFQHNLGLAQSLKTYRSAVFWSVIASFCIVMEGYDTLLLGSLFALPAFAQHFGYYVNAKTGYTVKASWQAALQQGANIGSFFGIVIGAMLVDRLGYKKTILGSLALMIPLIALVTFAPNKGALLAGEILCGLPWGVFSTLAEAYASEVCPLALRGYLTTFVNLCWVIGHLVGAGILRKAAVMTGVWSYRMPFAVQWVWPVPLFLMLLFAPESPWWLVRKGKMEQAAKSIDRLAPAQEAHRTDDTIAAMIRTNQLEMHTTQGTSWSDCFRGTDRRRTEISMVVWTTQIMCGLQFANYSTYFFEQAGLSTLYSFDMTIALYAAAFIGTVLSWVLLTYFGRRTIFIAGLACLAAGQLLIGILSVVADKGHSGARWAQSGKSLLLVEAGSPDVAPGVMVAWLFTYDLTVGPLAYAIVGEVSSTRLRNKTVGLSRMSYNVFSVVFGVLTPYMLNPTEWAWKGKIGFFWGPIGLCLLAWAYFRLPEMKGRTYYEIDIMFQRGVPARKFKRTIVEAEHA